MPVSTMPELSHANLTAELTPRLAFDRSACPPQPAVRLASPASIRRRGSAEQGRALESLGHAVEYLVDSRVRFRDPQEMSGERDAIEILMRLNRAVFAECPEVVPFGRRIRQWVTGHLPGF